MHDRRVRFPTLDNLCRTFVRHAGLPLKGKAGVGRAILPWALCLVVAAEGCPQTRLPNLVPTPYDADKRSFNVHDPLPETDIGPDTGARPRDFMQDAASRAALRSPKNSWAFRPVARTMPRQVRRRPRRDSRPVPTSQLYPDAVPQ